MTVLTTAVDRPSKDYAANRAALLDPTVRGGASNPWTLKKTLRARKMRHQANAPADGVVAELPVGVGRQIDVGAVLAVVTDTDEDNPEE